MKLPISFPKSSRGFSLVEMMVVLTIILGLTGSLALISGKNNSNTKVQAAAATAATMMQSARELALTRNTTALLLVNNDSADQVNYRRALVLVYQELDQDGHLVSWRQEGKKVMLPEGIFYDVAESTAKSTEDAGPGSIRLDLSGDLQEGQGPEWVRYEFSSNGVCLQSGAGFVVLPETGNPGADASAKRVHESGGFVVQRLGGMLSFQ